MDANGFAPPIRGNLTCDQLAFASWWCKKGFDRLMTQASVESDLAKRTTIMRQASKALVDDVSHTYLIVVPQCLDLAPKIKGWRWTSVSFYNFDAACRVE